MRSVKSEGLFEQMKGRGTRTISDTDLQSVTPDATKTHFVLIDAVGICERIKTDDPPLERKASIPLKNLLNSVAVGKRDPATLTSLAGRLGRLARRATAEEGEQITSIAGGRTIRELAAGLIDALDPDKQLERVKVETGQTYITLDQPEAKTIVTQIIKEAVKPFHEPMLRDALLKVQQRDEQIIDEVSQDTLLSAGSDAQDNKRAHQSVKNFQQFIEQHRDELTALQIYYRQP